MILFATSRSGAARQSEVNLHDRPSISPATKPRTRPATAGALHYATCVRPSLGVIMKQRFHSAIAGPVAMIVSSGLLTANDAISKHLALTLSVGQIVFFRQLGVVILLLAFLGVTGRLSKLRVQNWGGQFLRAAVFMTTMFTIVQALFLFPLPIVSAGIFSSPIVTALLSAPLLGEAVGMRRWTAAVVGFIGALIIIRPGAISFTWLSLLPFVPALLIGLLDIVTRRLTRTDAAIVILLISNIFISIAAAAVLAFGGDLAIGQWRPIPHETAVWLALNSFLNLAAHFFMIQALQLGDAALVAPFKYTGLIWAFLIALLWWDYVPDIATVVGSGCIVVSGLIALAPPRTKV